MKPNGKFFHSRPAKRLQAGFALLDVVLAIAVFAFGMLALIQLQGNLARSSSDANARTGAANIAEELVETLRGYRTVLADPDNGLWDYVEMEGNALNDTVRRGGIDYGRTVTITNFWWDKENDTFIRTQTAEPPAGLESLLYPDFKLLRLDVSWDNSDDFYVSDDSGPADLGTGSITIYEIISSSPPILGAQLASSLDQDSGPLVEFNPGANPDIIALQLDGERTKFKESSSPEPTVINSGGVRETWFDVVTYNGLDNSIFLRREEFVVVNCECVLEQGNGGYRPTLWNGYDYTEGEFVSDKDNGFNPKGPNDPGQSVFCDTCCRDHHDGGAGENDTNEVPRIVYDPYSAPINPPTEDHTHYKLMGNSLAEADYGDTYAEACRLIRKDGFFRVTHDFNQQALFAFPNDYLDVPSEVAEYSGYVVEAVTRFVQNDNVDFKQPGDAPLVSDFLVPASSSELLPVETAPTSLPTPLGFPTQQLRSRGIYVDYLTDELRTNIANCPGTGCVLPGYTVPQEMYPFLEIQLTALSRWAENPINHPVDVFAELFEDDTGLAEHDGSGGLQSEVETRIHKMNIGFTGMDPIVPADLDYLGSSYRAHNLYINAFTEAPPPVNAYLVEGSITKGAGVPNNVKPSNTVITFDQAECNRTPTGYQCLAPMFDTGTVTFTDTSANKALHFCDVSGSLTAGPFQAAANDSWATFILPHADAIADIVIQTSGCDPDP